MAPPGIPIPLTIVGGFLGAGKTCLLNHILRRAPGRRIAVLVNDFGKVNIDARLIVSITGETVSLVNGCVCCTIRDDLLTEVIKLLRMPRIPEHIVIETSGVSNPRLVAETFLNPSARQLVELRNLIAVLDAELAVAGQGPYCTLAMDQIASADVVVVNKTDLVSQEDRRALRRRIVAMVSGARVWETAFGALPLELIFDDPPAPALAARRRESTPAGEPPHAGQFDAWIYRSGRRWSFNEIQRATARLPADIYRAKGTLGLALAANTYGVFHMTGKRSWLSVREAEPPATPATELVFIGKPGLVTSDIIRAQFEAAIDESRAAARKGRGYLVPDLRAFSVLFGE